MNKYLYDAETNAFYPIEKKAGYEAVGMWPKKGIEVDEILFSKFQSPPAGKIRIGGADGMPAWGDIPPLTKDEIIGQAISEKAFKIAEANAYMNEKQWPGKAALFRLKDDDKIQYGLWLDYLDELEAVNPAIAPDITWPSQP